MTKLILTHEVSNLGEPGDVVEVKDGYARNYLLPRNYAIRWTRGAAKQVESIQAARAGRKAVRAAGLQRLDRRELPAHLRNEPSARSVRPRFTLS